MLGGKSNQKIDSSGGELNTIIGANSVVEGTLNIQNSIRVNGKVIGELKTTGSLTIGNQGYVEGSIKASSVVIGGKVKGTIISSNKIILESTSVFIGDLQTPSLSIAEGSVFDGKCSMDENVKFQIKEPEKKIETKEFVKEEKNPDSNEENNEKNRQ